MCVNQVFEKDLNRTTLTDLNNLLQDGITNKMKILKDAKNEISFFTNFKVEITNQAFALNLKNCI